MSNLNQRLNQLNLNLNIINETYESSSTLNPDQVSIDDNLANLNYYYKSNSVNDQNRLFESMDLNNFQTPIMTTTSQTNENSNKLSSNKSNKKNVYSTSHQYGDNLLSNTLNQLDKEHLCRKSYFDNIPPEIEMSVYGSETLPENSILETENTMNTSGAETENTFNTINTIQNYTNNYETKEKFQKNFKSKVVSNRY